MENYKEEIVNLRQGEEEEEEALSLCDLPMIHNSRKLEKDEEKSTSNNSPVLRASENQEDFDFCCVSKESEMCAADEVFFQGQIMPLRHSVSSERGLMLQYCGSGSVCRSESMEYYSSRSSSMSSSNQSSSSGSSSHHKRPKPPQNQFHSHPSPSPRLYSSNRTHVNSNNRNSTKKTSSALWNIFRPGLVTAPPETFALQDLKTRRSSNNTTNYKNFGSRNSTGSNTSSLSSTTNNKKKKGFLSGCMCTNDAVDTVNSNIKQIKKSASEGEIQAPRIEDENENIVESMKPQAAKKHLSHHRTFEWVKQLSVEASADEA